MKHMILLIITLLSINSNSEPLNVSVDYLLASHHYVLEGMNEVHKGIGLSYSTDTHTTSIGKYVNSFNEQSKYISYHYTLIDSTYYEVSVGATVVNGYSMIKEAYYGVTVMPSLKLRVKSSIYHTDLIFTPVAVGFSIGLYVF